MDIKRENGKWYTLKIAIINGLIKIYVNDLLAAEVPTFNNFSDTNVITNKVVQIILHFESRIILI